MQTRPMPRHSQPAARLIGLALAGSATALIAEPPPATIPKLMGLAAFNLDQGPVGRTSSVDTRMAELDANPFWSPTSPSGQAIFDIDSNFSGFTKKQFGGPSDWLQFGAAAGYTNNAYNVPDPWKRSSPYFGGAVDWFKTVPLANGTAYFGVDASHYFYTDHLLPRSGSDDDLQQYGLRGGLFLNLAPNLQFSTRNQFSYGSFGTFGMGTVRTGVLDMDLSSWRSESFLNYRFGPGGFGGATGFYFGGYNENGGQYWDNSRYHISQEFYYSNGGPTFFVNGRYGWNNFWHAPSDNYDARYCGFMGGLRGNFPCGVGYEFGAGWERWQYNDSFLKDRNVFRAEARIEGRINEHSSLSFLADYGIQPLLPNEGSLWLLDPQGLRSQIRYDYRINDRLDAHAFVENQLLDGNIINGAPTARYNRSGFGLGLDWTPLPDNNKLTVSPGITWTFTDRNSTLGGQNNDQVIGTLRTTFSF